MNERTQKPLIRRTEDCYGPSFKADLLEQYKLYAQSADNVSARRVSSGRYLLTINAALVAAYGFQAASSGQGLLALPVALAGIVISVLSFHIIKSLRNLNRVKYEVIHELENHLPADLYAYEWQLLEEGRGKVYRPVSHIEVWIPIVFLVLHAVALASIVVLTIVGVPGWAKWDTL